MPGKCLKCKIKSRILCEECIRPQYIVPVKNKIQGLEGTEKQGFFQSAPYNDKKNRGL